MKVNFQAFLVKLTVLALIMYLCPSWCGVGICLFVTVAYPSVIALIYCVHRMPSMDAACFLGKDNARVNFISITTFDKYNFERVRERNRQYLIEKPKLMWHVVEILGDYYWKEMSDVDKACDLIVNRTPKNFANERELEQFVNEEINKPIPLDEPQWKIWF